MKKSNFLVVMVLCGYLAVTACSPPANQMLNPIEVSTDNFEPIPKRLIETALAQLPEKHLIPEDHDEKQRRAAIYGDTGMVLDGFKQLDAALAAYRNASILDPTEPRWPYLSALILSQRAEYDQALSLLRRAFELAALQPYPDAQQQVANLYRQADILHKQKHHERALETLRSALSIRENAGAIWFSIGQNLVELGRYQQAIAPLSKAVDFLRANDNALYTLGRAYRNLGETEKAKQQFSKMRDQPQPVSVHDPWQRSIQELTWYPRTLNSAANQLVALGEPDRALALLRRAWRMDPKDFQTLFNLGFVSGMLGDRHLSCDYYLQALNVNPDDARSHILVGHCYADRQLDGMASELLESGLALNPNERQVLISAGHLALKLNRPKLALQQFEQALALSPSDQDAQRGLEQSKKQLSDAQ